MISLLKIDTGRSRAEPALTQRANEHSHVELCLRACTIIRRMFVICRVPIAYMRVTKRCDVSYGS